MDLISIFCLLAFSTSTAVYSGGTLFCFSLDGSGTCMYYTCEQTCDSSMCRSAYISTREGVIARGVALFVLFLVILATTTGGAEHVGQTRGRQNETRKRFCLFCFRASRVCSSFHKSSLLRAHAMYTTFGVAPALGLIGVRGNTNHTFPM